MTLIEFETQKIAQDGKCAICEKELQAAQRTAIDHCHRTGRTRKLLCNQCNRGIGYLQDDPATVFKAFTYLELNT